MAGLLCAGLLCVGLAACVIEQATLDPSGRLEILAPDPGFGNDSPGVWAFVTADPAQGPDFRTEDIDGVPALRVTNGTVTGLIYRNTDTILSVAPYLSWAWVVDPHGGPQHPVRLLVGFHGGNPESGSRGSQPLVWTGADLPPYDRLLTLGWDASALRRGDLSPARGNPLAPRHYTVRGGGENLGRWHLETVDLDGIYRMAWPGDDPSRARIVFVGLAVLGSPIPASAHVSGIVLSR